MPTPEHSMRFHRTAKGGCSMPRRNAWTRLMLVAVEWMGALALVATYAAQGQLVSTHPIPSQTVMEGASSPLLSPDGQVILFYSESRNLLTNGPTTEGLQLYRHDLVSGTTSLLSVDALGTGGSLEPWLNPSMSHDGSRVAIESTATNVVLGGTNRSRRIYLRDVTTHTNLLIDVDHTGTGHLQDLVPPDEALSGHPLVSPDGRWVAFQSRATDLDPDRVLTIPNIFSPPYYAAFIRDLASNTTRMASVSIALSDRSPNGDCHLDDMTPDGRFILFRSVARDAGFYVTSSDPSTNLFVRDMTLGPPVIPTYVVQSHGIGMYPRTEGWFFGDAHLSADGQTVLYKMERHGCGPEAANALVVRYDILAVQNTILTTNAVCTIPIQLSTDGSRLLCQTGELDGSHALRLWDTVALTNQPVALNREGTGPPNQPVLSPVLSRDGSSLVFVSAATDLTEDPVSGNPHLYHHDIETGTTRLITRAASGLPSEGDFETAQMSLSEDGQRVVFDSHATDLVEEDFNQDCDVFAWSVSSDQVELISRANPTLPQLSFRAHTRLGPHGLSADGRTVAFTSEDQAWTGQDTNRLKDAHWWKVAESTALPMSATNGFFDPERFSTEPEVNADGSAAVFYRADPDPDSPLPPKEGEVWGWLPPDGLFLLHDAAHLPSHDTSPSLSGSRTAFLSITNGRVTTLVHDLNSGALQSIHSFPISHWAVGRPLQAPRFSPDGAWLAYPDMTSYLQFLILARHLETGEIRTVAPATNRSVTGAVWNAASDRIAYQRQDDTLWIYDFPTDTRSELCENCLSPSFSADGQFVAYLQRREFELGHDVHLRNLATGETEFITAEHPDTPVTRDSSSDPGLSHDARFLVYSSLSEDILLLDANGHCDVVLLDRLAGQTYLISVNRTGTGGGNGHSSRPVLAANGRTLAFQSFANDLALGDQDRRRDIFLVQLGGDDLDGDGMEDDWEVAWFNTLARDGTGDFDGDGQTDLAEFQSGTIPTSDTSLLRILRMTSLPGNQVVLLWSTSPGRQYQVACKEEAGAPAWTPCGDPITAQGTQLSWVDTQPVTRRFYRVSLIAP